MFGETNKLPVCLPAQVRTAEYVHGEAQPQDEKSPSDADTVCSKFHSSVLSPEAPPLSFSSHMESHLCKARLRPSHSPSSEG